MKKSVFQFLGILSLITFVACGNNETKSNEPFTKTTPEWSFNQTIYEVNIRQFSEEGTIRKVEEQLPRLKELGVGILWLMPVHPIGELNRKGSMGSYYAVKDYKKFNPDYGTEDDLRSFINAAHSLGMYVIFDWVANHTAWDNVWVEEHPEFYTKDSLGNFVPPVADWSDVIDLNYDNPGLREAMADALVYWVKEFDLDGYRCDVAAMVPSDFWLMAREKMEEVKPVFMLAEAHEPELHHSGFEMTYNWQLKDLVNNIAKREKNALDVVEHIEKEKSEYPVDAFRMTFTTNHDENSWSGTVFERLGDGVEALYVLVATLDGMPLVYSGQESGMDKRLEFFEKDPIAWGNYKYSKFYGKLLDLNKKNKAMWNGKMGSDVNLIKSSDVENVICFTREKDDDKVLVIINLSPDEREVTLEGENLAGVYTNLYTEETAVMETKETLTLSPWQYLVYSHK